MKKFIISTATIIILSNLSVSLATENHIHSDTKMEAHNPANETTEVDKTYHSHANKKHKLDDQKMNSQIISGPSNTHEAHSQPEPLSNENTSTDEYSNHPMNSSTLRDR